MALVIIQIIIVLIIIMFATTIATVIVGISSSSGILTFIVALISGLSAATLWLPLMKVGNLLENRLFNKIEGTLYIKELARVAPQIQVQVAEQLNWTHAMDQLPRFERYPPAE